MEVVAKLIDEDGKQVGLRFRRGSKEYDLVMRYVKYLGLQDKASLPEVVCTDLDFERV